MDENIFAWIPFVENSYEGVSANCPKHKKRGSALGWEKPQQQRGKRPQPAAERGTEIKEWQPVFEGQIQN